MSPREREPGHAEVVPHAAVVRVVVVAVSPGALASVGGVPLAVRAVLALRGAGFTDIALFAGRQMARVRELLAKRGSRADVLWIDASGPAWAPAGRAPILVVSGDVLFDPRVFGALVRVAGSQRIRGGVSPLSHVPGIHVAMCLPIVLPELLAKLGTGSLDQAIRDLGGIEGPPVPLAEGLFMPLDSTRSPTVLTKALLKDLARRTAATDGYLAALLDRRLSGHLTRLLLPWPVTPNQITVASMIIGLAGAVGLASISYAGRVWGALALMASSVLDGVDGEVARARFQQSPSGARLDLAGDYVTHLATFLGLGIGLLRQGLPRLGVWAAVALAGGVTGAMAMMHAVFVRPALTTSGDLHGRRNSRKGADASVRVILERVAGRDYTYLLLALALIGHLDWFLYGAAAGSWGFVLGLLGYWSRRRSSVSSKMRETRARTS